jgi:type III secretory pathway component EscV
LKPTWFSVFIASGGEKMSEKTDNIRGMLGKAIRGEMEAERLYTGLSNASGSIFLSERFRFLAREEEKQRKVLENLAEKIFGEKMDIPEESGLPLPDIRIRKGDELPLKDLIDAVKKANEAEKEISDTYMLMSKSFEEGSPERRMLEFLGYLSEEHCEMLERKAIKLEKFGFVDDAI